MTPKERFLSAAHFKAPDKPALEYNYSKVGYAEHGEKLLELYKKYPGDTAPAPSMDSISIPRPEPENILPDGRYLKIEKDEWGVTWEYRVFGYIGHAISFPLESLDSLDDYGFPPIPLNNPENMEALKRTVRDQGSTYPVSYGIPGLLDRMISLCPFENVLSDLASRNPALERLADRLTDRFEAETRLALSAGVDIIRMGDDYGTERALLTSPQMWREFLLPRLKRIIKPVKDAGKTCCFHSCGYIWDILDDLKEAGADTIWPQLPLYDYGRFAEKLRRTGLALCIHIDRGELMHYGSPDMIKREVGRIYDEFRPDRGGSWFYVEVDEGFPFENVVALVEAVDAYRR